MSTMKQWVVGLTALSLLFGAGTVASVGAQDEEKSVEKGKDKDVEEIKKPPMKEESGSGTGGSGYSIPSPSVVQYGSYPCPAPVVSYNYRYVTQYQQRARTICEYVPVTTMVDAVEITCEEVKTPKTRRVIYCKEVRTPKTGKRCYYKPVTKTVPQKVCVYKWVDDVVQQTYYKCVPKKPREETHYTYECRPTQTKKTIEVDQCETYTVKEPRTCSYTYQDVQAVTKYYKQVIQSPCPPDPCAPAVPPQVVCVPYTAYQCVPKTVVHKYDVDVVKTRTVKKPVDVIICGYETVKKPYTVTIQEYENVKVVENVKVKVCKPVIETQNVTICEYEKVEEPYTYEEITYKEEPKDEPYTEITYKEVRKPVKRPCTTWQLQKRVICETVPVQVLVAEPCYSAPSPSCYSPPAAVVPGPTCY